MQVCDFESDGVTVDKLRRFFEFDLVFCFIAQLHSAVEGGLRFGFEDIFAVLGFHLVSVQLHGMSQGIDGPPKRQEKFFPTFFLRDLRVWGLAFMVLFILGLCLPFESLFSYPLFEPYNPKGSTPDGIKPEWYFFPVFRWLKRGWWQAAQARVACLPSSA